MEADLASTFALLAATPAALDALLRHLPDSLTHAHEGEGTWTVAQVLAHLIHGERTDWLPRVQIILRAGETVPFPAVVRETSVDDSRSLPQLLNEFAQVRAASLAQLRALDLSPLDLERCGQHPAFGRVTLSQLMATWPAHDLSHLHQIARILAVNYREAVGPWSRYLGVLHCEGHSEKA